MVLALLKLKSTTAGKVIPLAGADTSLKPGQPLEVTGWAATAQDGDVSHDLRKARVPYAENATCNEPASYHGPILPGMVCAGYRGAGMSSCQGDSGAPPLSRTS